VEDTGTNSSKGCISQLLVYFKQLSEGMWWVIAVLPFSFRQFECIFSPASIPSSVWPYIPLLVPALIYSYQYDASWQIQLNIEWWFLRRSFLKHFPNTAYVNNSLDHQDWNPINIVDPRGLHSHI
jgi:hypothetical protein